VFTEVLPAAAGEAPAAIRWTPGSRAGTGTLGIQAARRCACTYAVTEFAPGWPGRAARFAKAEGQAGSDREADGYDVFVSWDGRTCRCDCKGFTRWGHCKHAAALAALVANGWLDLHLSSSDADARPTEPGDGLIRDEETARVTIRARLRELVGYPAAGPGGFPAGFAWLASAEGGRLLRLIGWDDMPPARVIALVTGYRA
jgi:hypothetical protein